MKILYLVTKDDVGGAQKYVADLSSRLDPARFEVKVITGGKGGARFLSNGFWPHLLFINDLLALVELFLIFKKERPTIVHLNSSKAGVIGTFAAKLAGVPKIIFTAHGWVFNPDNYLGFARRWLYIAMHKAAGHFQDHIINVSEYDRGLALKYKIASPSKLITIRNGLDLTNSKFLDKKTARKALATLAGLNLSTDELINSPWVGSIGRLVAEKSYKDFIDAAALVKDQSVKFFIIGDGFLRSKLEHRIKKSGLTDRFFLVSKISPAAPYLRAFDLFLLSSIKEGLPYTLLEAMAAGLPIIVTRVGGMPEIVSGRGLVMPPREPEELARAINYYLEQPAEAEKSAKEAGRFIKSDLTIERMIGETEKVYLTA